MSTININTINRLQFRYHDEVFETREDAVNYIKTNIRENRDIDESFGYSLLGEPTVLLYKTDTYVDEKDAHLILAVGSYTNSGNTWHENNRFCIIDIDKTEQEIADLGDELEAAIKSLTLIALSSDTLNFYANKTEDGTYVSGDVKTAKTHIFNGSVKENNLAIFSASEKGPEGLYVYVDLSYDEVNEAFTFTVSQSNGTLKETTVTFPNNYLVSGKYVKQDESLHLNMKNGDEVVVDCEELIAEWGVEGEASETPIVLTREEVDYDNTEEHHHVEPWQDVLRADVRIADYINSNILEKTDDGRYLYVDGRATNIAYYWNGELSNVSEQLDKLNQIKVSSDNDNIIWNRVDGFFATTKLDYISNKNKLMFTTSNVSGGTTIKEIQLNSVELFQNVYYDRTTEELVVTYKDTEGNLKVVRIPIGEMLDEWEVLNEGHNVRLAKTPHQVSGKDILTADAKIHEGDNNILEDRNHELYVNGVAANIKYEVTGDTTVKDVLDGLKDADQVLDDKIDAEIARAESAETELQAAIKAEGQRAQDAETTIINTIGSGFSTDAHETVTYKFEQLQNQVNSEAEKLQNEIDRSTSADTVHDGRLDIIETEIGDGFGPRFTIKDAIDALSADTSSSLKDIINNDNSIGIDKTDAIRPIVKVNLSTVESGNTIRLEGDGLYNFIDLNYDPDTNKLTLTKSDQASTENVIKELQLNSVSVIDGMEYDPATETLIIKYHSGSEQKELRIPLGEIFQEWEVYNDPDSAVKLHRERVIDGKDKLSGTVVVSTAHTDNILVNEHGALYVSGAQIEANKNAIASLSGMVDGIEDEIDALEDALEDEISRATNVENVLSGAIQSEVTRATNAESSLRTDLTNTQNSLASEISRSIAKDQELESAINNEIIRATSAETTLSNAIQIETTRATNAENSLRTDITSTQNSLASEITRATTAEGQLNVAIQNETSRAISAETALNDRIAQEILDRTSGDASLAQLISNETTSREAKDTIIESKIDAEITRSTAEDTRLSNAITAETEARQQGDARLEQMINNATLTFDDTTSIDFTKTTGNVVTADVKLQGGDNIIKLGQGLYATATLEYEPTGNKIRLVTSNGAQEYIQLVGATLLDSIEYDPVNKMLIITYTDGTGSQRETSVGVTDLWNEWIVQNPSEKSAIELTKTIGDPGNPDTLKGRILITDDYNGDGVPDAGSDNLIEIRNNGLYVSGAAISGSQETAACAMSELKVLERVVIGHIIGGECGSGYDYEPNNTATYINTATSFNNADYILDQSIKNLDSKVDVVSGNVECVDSKADKMYEMLYGVGHTMPACGEGASYQPYVNGCVISGATSFQEADQMLDQQICGILNMWTSGETCTTKSEWINDGANRKIEVHGKISHGNSSLMSDSELYITNSTGDYIDPTTTEFTDTNALRIVCLEDGGGVTPAINTPQNGYYLSNVWDCGLYYGTTAEDQAAKAAAEAAGYNTNYSTDETITPIDYTNKARQSDIPQS